jgi:hypothetical protein
MNPEYGDDPSAEVDFDNPEVVVPEWPKYLNVYEVIQAWGGPEEGGWWYNCGTPLESVRADNDEQQKEALVRLEQRYAMNDQSDWDRERKRGKSSSAGGYDITIYVERNFAEPFPQRRPHYE